MLRTVNLYRQFCTADIKIDNITAKNILPFYSYIKFFEEIIPKMSFFLSHRFS